MSDVDVADQDLDQLVGRHLRTRSEQLTLAPADLTGIGFRRDRRRRRRQRAYGLAAGILLLVGATTHVANDGGDDRRIRAADDAATKKSDYDLSADPLGTTNRAVTSQPVVAFGRLWALGPTGEELMASEDGVHWDLAAGHQLADAGIYAGMSGVQVATDGEILVVVGVSSEGAVRAATISHDGQIGASEDVTPPLGAEARVTLFSLSNGFAVGVETPTEAGQVLFDAERRLHELARSITDYESLATSHADPPGDAPVTLLALDGSVLHETTMSELGLTADEAAALLAQTTEAATGLTEIRAFLSANGRNWTETDLPKSFREDSSFVRASGAIALHPGGHTLVASEDGENWTTASFPQSSAVDPIAGPRQLLVTRSSAWLVTGVPGYLLHADDLSGPFTRSGIDGQGLSTIDNGDTIAVVHDDDDNDTPPRPRVAFLDSDTTLAEVELPASSEQRSWILVPRPNQSVLAVETGDNGQVHLIKTSV